MRSPILNPLRLKLSQGVLRDLPPPPRAVTQRTQHIVVLSSMTYHSARFQSTVSKEKRYIWRSQAQLPLLVVLPWTCWILPARNWEHLGNSLLGELLNDSVPRGLGFCFVLFCFVGADHLGPVCSALLKIQIPRRKAGIQHNCIGCTNCWNTVIHSYQKVMGKKYKVPKTTQGSTLHVSLQRLVTLGPAMLTLLSREMIAWHEGRGIVKALKNTHLRIQRG